MWVIKTVFFPAGGYVNDPQLSAHNLQRAAEAKGAAFRFNAGVTEIRQAAGRVAGITLGHDGAAHAHPAYQMLLRNAVRWVGAE